jgi:hypothetical protein
MRGKEPRLSSFIIPPMIIPGVSRERRDPQSKEAMYA